MKRVPLKEICRIVSGATPKRNRDEYWGGDIPWVTPKEISSLEGPFLFESMEKITEAGYKSCSTEILPVNSLLMSSRAPIGLFAINKIPVCTNQGFKSLIPSNEIDVLFLYYYLKFHVDDIKSRGRGATFKEISKSIVENYPIYLPPRFEQTRSATLLFKVESLIAKRKKSIADLDELLKNTFLEMFSIKDGGFKKWEIDNLSKHSEVVSGVAKGKKYNKTKLIEILYLRVANVQDGFFNLDEVKTIFVSDREIDKCLLVLVIFCSLKVEIQIN